MINLSLSGPDAFQVLENLLKHPLSDKNDQERIVSILKVSLLGTLEKHEKVIKENVSLFHSTQMLHEEIEALKNPEKAQKIKTEREEHAKFVDEILKEKRDMYFLWREAQEKKIDSMKKTIANFSLNDLEKESVED